MALNKTEFIKGMFLSYPLESLPKLFGVLGAVSRKGFFEKLVELDGAGGAGLSIDNIIQIIHVGLGAEYPQLTINDTKKLVSEFYEENGQEALEFLVVDALADARLSDKKVIEKRRALLQEMKDLEMKRMELILQSKTSELAEVEARFAEKVAGMGNQNQRENQTPKGKNPKKKI